MASLSEFLISALLVISGIFGFVGSFGLIKLRDSMSRLHAPTKATTVGVGAVLIASMIHAATFEAYPSFHELLITLFLVLTAPVTAFFIAKVHILRHETPQSLPRPHEDRLWATHDTDEGEQAGDDRADKGVDRTGDRPGTP